MYVIIDFSDNDFSHDLSQALAEVYEEEVFKFCPIILKRFIIAYVVGAYLKKHAMDTQYDDPLGEAEHYFDYLSSGVRILVETSKPVYGQFHGDAVWALDCNTGYVWYAGA
jgi:hypothetical protein